MSDLVKCVLSDTAFGLATFIITYIVYAVRIKKSVMILLQINIYTLYKECKDAKYRTPIDSKAFNSMLEQYYKLGGDDYIHDVAKRFNEIEEKYV